ncbi:MAG: hypothetical protein AAF628_08285 [Planctomycetota bacterium]
MTEVFDVLIILAQLLWLFGLVLWNLKVYLKWDEDMQQIAEGR